MAKPVVKKSGKPSTKPKTPKVNNVPVYVQPAFSQALTHTLSKPFGYDGGANAAGASTDYGIRRGFMVWDKTVPPPSGYSTKDPNYPAVFKFLFNPSTISTSYQVASGAAQAALNYGTTQGLSSSLLLPLQQQTSFSLMFDRTYELNNQKATSDILNFGVDVDIAALRQFTGMYAGIYSQGANSNANYIPFSASNTETSSSGTAPTNLNQTSANVPGPLGGNLAQGVMQVTLGYCYFSGPTSSAVGGKGYGITYYGYIDSWSVEYTHFTNNMIPMRAVVDISFTFLPPPTKAADTAGAATIAAAQDVANAVSKLNLGGLTIPNPLGPGTAGR
jgi:hypothetical protein